MESFCAISLTPWFKTNDYLNNSDVSNSDETALKAAAEAVRELDKQTLELEKRGRKRKFSERHHFDQATREAIGKFATVHGNKSAVKKFSKRLGFAVSEATVRNFKRDVQNQIKGGKSLDEVQLPAKKRRPLLLPEIRYNKIMIVSQKRYNLRVYYYVKLQYMTSAVAVSNCRHTCIYMCRPCQES